MCFVHQELEPFKLPAGNDLSFESIEDLWNIEAALSDKSIVGLLSRLYFQISIAELRKEICSQS